MGKELQCVGLSFTRPKGVVCPENPAGPAEPTPPRRIFDFSSFSYEGRYPGSKPTPLFEFSLQPTQKRAPLRLWIDLKALSIGPKFPHERPSLELGLPKAKLEWGIFAPALADLTNNPLRGTTLHRRADWMSGNVSNWDAHGVPVWSPLPKNELAPGIFIGWNF